MNWRSAWILATLGGCGTETGNPDLVFLGYNARTSAPSTLVLGDRDDRVSVSSVWLRLDEVALSTGCGADPTVATFEGLGFADHADEPAVVQEVDFDSQPVCAFETTLVPDPEASGEPEDVAGTSVALLGTLADGRAFQVLLREEIPISFELANEPVPEFGQWLLSFDVAAWLDVAQLEEVSGDPITVSIDQNPAVYGGIMARFLYGVQLHADVDADGQVDFDERRIDVP